MTDYLTRLAKRTLGLLPVAQSLITPSFSSFASRINDRPEISFIENVALFDQQVIPGTQEREAPQAFLKSRSKVQKTAKSRNELSPGKTEHSDSNANNSLLLNKKFGTDSHDQRQPGPDFMRQDSRSKPQSVHIEKQLPSKNTGIEVEEKYGEGSFTLLDHTLKPLKNNRHRRIPEMTGPKIEKEMTGSMTEKEMKNIDIPDPISFSKSLEDPFSEKYGEGHLPSVLTSDLKKESRRSIDIFSEKHINKQSNLNKKSNLDSSVHKLNPEYPGTPDILLEPEKLISSDPTPGRVAWFSEKDRSIVKNQEHNEMNRKTGFKNLMDPVIKSPERQDHSIRDIHSKIQQPPIPTIKVTIGRVEVRAIPPQPVFNPSPAMKKPALSLDEYLKQHNG